MENYSTYSTSTQLLLSIHWYIKVLLCWLTTQHLLNILNILDPWSFYLFPVAATTKLSIRPQRLRAQWTLLALSESQAYLTIFTSLVFGAVGIWCSFEQSDLSWFNLIGPVIKPLLFIGLSWLSVRCELIVDPAGSVDSNPLLDSSLSQLVHRSSWSNNGQSGQTSSDYWSDQNSDWDALKTDSDHTAIGLIWRLAKELCWRWKWCWTALDTIQLSIKAKR